MITLATGVQTQGNHMRNPLIDLTALVARLRGVDEDYYANALEDAVDALNKKNGNTLSPEEVTFFGKAIAELSNGDTEERKIAGSLREFISIHKSA